MTKKEIATGVVHKVPADLRKTLASVPAALAAWEDITSLARNEWICWVESAKKVETRSHRIDWTTYFTINFLQFQRKKYVAGLKTSLEFRGKSQLRALGSSPEKKKSWKPC